MVAVGAQLRQAAVLDRGDHAAQRLADAAEGDPSSTAIERRVYRAAAAVTRRRRDSACLQGYTRFAAPWQGRAAPDPNPSVRRSDLSLDLPRAKAPPPQRASRSKILLALLVLAVCARDRGAVGWPATCCRSPPRRPPLESLKPIDQGTSSAVYAADGTPPRLHPVRRDPDADPAAADPGVDAGRDGRDRGRALLPSTAASTTRASCAPPSRTSRPARRSRAARRSRSSSCATSTSGRERTLERKIREARLAEELEDEHSKRLDPARATSTRSPYGTVDGQTAVGVQAAAQTFFAKPAKNLTLEESALLAGLPQAPSELNPFQNPRDALERRNEVLEKMAELGYISDARAPRGDGARRSACGAATSTSRSASRSSSTTSSSS